MSKGKEAFIGLMANNFLCMLWIYKMIITSDIPVEMKYKDFIIISIVLIVFLLIYSFYIRKIKYSLINILSLLIPSSLWFATMKQALIYQYHKYDTIVSIIAYSITLFLILQLIYLKVRKIRV